MQKKLQPFFNFKGHYRARTLAATTQEALKKNLPSLTMQPEEAARGAKLFSTPTDKLCLEVGFGAGEYLLEQIQQNPTTGFIGCEPYMNGVAKFLDALEAQGLGAPPNLRLYQGNGLDLLPHLPPHSLNRFVLLYPDPWPKRRHAKHRFIQSSVLDALSQVLVSGGDGGGSDGGRDGGSVFFASDDSQLVAWVLAHFLAHPHFAWQKEKTCHVGAGAPALTRYEKKALEEQKKAPVRLAFVKK